MLELDFTQFPTLETERLILRKVTTTDSGAIFNIRSDKRFMPYLNPSPTTTVEKAEQEVQRMIDSQKKNEGIAWAITLKGDTKLIGTVGFWRIEKGNYRGETGYILDADYRGKGIMQEAMLTTINCAFSKMNLHSIVANIAPENVPSIKLVEKCGFTREGYFKENYFKEGKFYDTASYCLVNSNQ